jgi:hypothetical protein
VPDAVAVVAIVPADAALVAIVPADAADAKFFKNSRCQI